jgi:hypothetical protein
MTEPPVAALAHRYGIQREIGQGGGATVHLGEIRVSEIVWTEKSASGLGASEAVR